MIKNKIKKYILVGLLAASLIVGLGGTLVKNHNIKEEAKQYPVQMIINESNDKLLIKNTVIDGVKEIKNLEILQMSMRKSVKIKQGDVFKKSQELTFAGVGKYYLDLSTINQDSVVVNSEAKTITLYCKLPQTTVSFFEDKTKYSEVEKSFLTFGDLKITPEEMESIKVKVKNEMFADLNKDENINIAIEKASKIVQETINILTQDAYKIDIKFIR